MKNKVVNISLDKVYSRAYQNFKKTSGLEKVETKKHKKMMEIADTVFATGKEGIDIKALVSFYGPEVLKGKEIIIDDTVISCSYFENILKEHVKGMYFYLIKAGEVFFSSEENIMDFLFADIWGTSFVEAGVDELEEEFLKVDMQERFKGQKAYLSSEFGPGYFGMPVVEAVNFFKILDADKIGVRVKESGLMIPQKSCVGLAFVYDTEDIKTNPECITCVGNSKGCAFCKIRKRSLNG